MTLSTRDAWSKVDLGMRSAGFRFAGTRGGVTTYRGDVRSGQIATPVRLEITDPLFTSPPKVFVEDAALSERIRAHLETGDSLCFAEGGVEEYDLYDAGGAALRVLESVKSTLAQAYHGSSVADQQREFVSYWKGETALYADLPLGFSGQAVSAGWNKGGRDTVVVATPDRLARWSDAKRRDAKPAYVLRTDRPLNTGLGEGPGRNLASVRRWLAQFVDNPAELDQAFDAKIVDKGVVLLAAENGTVAAQFAWPELARIAFAKAPLVRRAKSIARGPDQMTLERSAVASLDLPTLVNARLAAPSPLIGRSVAIIGAGAIGSRVALELARCGVGQSDRPMLIVDPDLFQTINFGRHVLPITAASQPKAAAMAEEVTRLHPGLSVEGVHSDVFRVLDRIGGYDLVIDATGANPVGLRLNEEAVSRRKMGRAFPTVLHAAIHGNGLAAQTVLVTPGGHACLKCLRPSHGVYKANPLKPGVAVEYTPGACGDGAHVNYAATAPIAAAGLVVQAALAWAADPDNPGPRVRTVRLDPETTQPIKDKNWPADPSCPACGDTAA